MPSGEVGKYGVLWYACSVTSSITYEPKSMREILKHESARDSCGSSAGPTGRISATGIGYAERAAGIRGPVLTPRTKD